MTAPCINCERKGCGSFHDECKQYQEYKGYVAELKEAKDRENAKYKETIPSKTFYNRCKDTRFKCHKR